MISATLEEVSISGGMLVGSREAGVRPEIYFHQVPCAVLAVVCGDAQDKTHNA